MWIFRCLLHYFSRIIPRVPDFWIVLASGRSARRPGLRQDVPRQMPTFLAARSASGDVVDVHYTGRLTNGTVFDSSVTRGKPFQFTIGSRMVITAWEEGIPTMRIGEKAILLCAPEVAYGAQGSPPTIPPNSVLEFEVELIAVKSNRSLTADGLVTREEWIHRTPVGRHVNLATGADEKEAAIVNPPGTEVAVRFRVVDPEDGRVLYDGSDLARPIRFCLDVDGAGVPLSEDAALDVTPLLAGDGALLPAAAVPPVFHVAAARLRLKDTIRVSAPWQYAFGPGGSDALNIIPCLPSSDWNGRVWYDITLENVVRSEVLLPALQPKRDATPVARKRVLVASAETTRPLQGAVCQLTLLANGVLPADAAPPSDQDLLDAAATVAGAAPVVTAWADQLPGATVTATLGDPANPELLDLLLASMVAGETASALGNATILYPGCGEEATHSPATAGSQAFLCVSLVSFDQPAPHWDLEPAQKLQQADTLRQQGNTLFRAKQPRRAARTYNLAADCLKEELEVDYTNPARPKHNPDLWQDIRQAQISIGSNLATAEFQLGHFRQALAASQKVLALDPNHVKALYRVASCHFSLKDYPTALESVDRALAKADGCGFSPTDVANFQNLRKSIRAAIKAEEDKTRATYKRMLGF
ncbi:peptidylprolyl isomerase [Fonticula alba]|uniref:peptidylprolyl isomerase n=1 Tax=Fonticula alba TaxID=691883 RepID=A0A058ZF30_FONAL|nr:peptidylprolyl isomerase [Fonticula alba]KCV72543.1 peptidylprolyl isomerase [Fonticula alba]|eukprot:XP_009492244.1 peptidylprolyl isomerase [Fonticula alba]